MLGAYQDFLAVVAAHREFTPITAWVLRLNLLKASRRIEQITRESNSNSYSYNVAFATSDVCESAGNVISLLLAILVEEKQRIDIEALSPHRHTTIANSLEEAIDSYLDCPRSLEKAYDVIYYIKCLLSYHKVDFTGLVIEKWEQDIKLWEQDIQ